MTKTCSVCEIEKPFAEFGKRTKSKDGLMPRCKVCERERSKAYRERNKEELSEKAKARYQKNRTKTLERVKKYSNENKERIKDYKRSYYLKNKEEIVKRNSKNVSKRRKESLELRVAHVVSNAVRTALKKQGKSKGGSTFSALPYSPQDLIEHLESQFDENMNWENYGSYWEIDHIYPQSLLPYNSLQHENFTKCWALSNLQPLELSENRSKSNKVI